MRFFKNNTVEELRKKTDEKVNDIPLEVDFFTDGSTDAQQNNGGLRQVFLSCVLF